MDFSNTLGQAVTGAVSYFPEELRHVIRHASNYLPAEVDLLSS